VANYEKVEFITGIMEDNNFNFDSRIDLSSLHHAMEEVRREVGKVIVGQNKMIDQLLVALLAKGHVLIEGVPGVAKTVTAKILARCLDMNFSRIQFTPDLMPSDIIGTSIFDASKASFTFKKGPIFSNFVLIDEINRAPAKTQAALFEVMEERQITADGTRYLLEEPFIVIATQNPIEHEGTYRLPEAQLDRFLFKIKVNYPSVKQELEIILREHQNVQNNKIDVIRQVLKSEDLLIYQKLVKQVSVKHELIQYIADIVCKTREHHLIYLGASPRASLATLVASKGFAALDGRDFVTPDDIKHAAASVLNHRIVVAPEREMEGLTSEQVIEQIIESIPIPR
jgi:MoxR-like ATPase